MKNFKTQKAFTLAETLITLVIIGVIAAITVPSLMQNFGNLSNNVALKKNYSVLSNAFELANKFDGNLYEDWSHADGNQEAIYQNYTYLRNHLNILRVCNDRPGCWSSELTKAPDGSTADGANANGIGGNIVTFTLMDGTNVCLDYWGKAQAYNLYGVNRNLLPATLVVWVDVNGDRKPNKLGKDVFAFILTGNGLVPAGADNNSRYCKTTGNDCAAKYLHASDPYK